MVARLILRVDVFVDNDISEFESRIGTRKPDGIKVMHYQYMWTEADMENRMSKLSEVVKEPNFQSSVETQQDCDNSDDDNILEQLGLRRELKRKFSKFTTVSFAMGIMGTAASITSTINTPLLLGGPAATVWAWLLGAVGCLAISCSVSELVSAYPTAGGIYTTTMFVVPKRYRSNVCFISAWITIVGQLATTASVNFALSEMIFAAVTMGTNGSFVVTPQQTFGLYAAINIVIGMINSLPTAFLHRISMGYVFVNLLATFSVIIGIFVGGGVRHDLASSEFVWTSIIDQSGWNNRGFVFLLGLLSVQWVMTDYDGAAHLAEEVQNAGQAIPLAIMTGSITTAILGFFVNVALCYGIKDITSLPGPTGLVVPQILWDNLGQKAGLVVFSFIISVQTVVALTCQLSSIRSIYAISRDNGLPDKKALARVWTRTRTPVNAAICVVVIETLLGLLSLASVAASNAVFSITAVALDLSYMIPVIFKLYIYWDKTTDISFRPGPFFLGRLGYAINIYAVLWTLLETGVLVMPQVFPVTAKTMNYAGPIMAGVCGASWLWYHLYWHRYYQGAHLSSNFQAPSQSGYSSSKDSFYEKKV